MACWRPRAMQRPCPSWTGSPYSKTHFSVWSISRLERCQPRSLSVLPGVERLDSGLCDEVVEQVNLVGFFEHGNEVAREDLSTLWIMPACERLERADLVRQGAQDRLVADGDAAAAQSLFKMVGDVVAYGVVHFIYPFPDTGIIIVTFIITFSGRVRTIRFVFFYPLTACFWLSLVFKTDVLSISFAIDYNRNKKKR